MRTYTLPKSTVNQIGVDILHIRILNCNPTKWIEMLQVRRELFDGGIKVMRTGTEKIDERDTPSDDKSFIKGDLNKSVEKGWRTRIKVIRLRKISGLVLSQ